MTYPVPFDMISSQSYSIWRQSRKPFLFSPLLRSRAP